MATRKQAKYEESLKRLEDLSKRYAEVEGARYQAQLTQQYQDRAKMEEEQRRARAREREHGKHRRIAQGIGAGVGLAAGIAGTAVTGDPKLIATGLQGGLAAGNLGGQVWNGEEIDPNNVIALGSAASGMGGSIQDYRKSESKPDYAKGQTETGYKQGIGPAAYGTSPTGGKMQPWQNPYTQGDDYRYKYLDSTGTPVRGTWNDPNESLV